MKRFFLAAIMAGSLLAAMALPAAASSSHTFSFFGPASCNHDGALVAELNHAMSDAYVAYGGGGSSAFHADFDHIVACGQASIFNSGVNRTGDPDFIAYVRGREQAWY